MICLVGFGPGDKVDLDMNGVRLDAAPERPLWIGADVPPEAMKQGENKLVVTFASGKAESLIVQSVELTVDYRGEEEKTSKVRHWSVAPYPAEPIIPSHTMISAIGSISIVKEGLNTVNMILIIT